MMIRPWVVPYSAVDGLVWVASAFGAELPYGPVVAVLGVKESNKTVEGVTVGSLGIRLAGAGALR